MFLLGADLFEDKTSDLMNQTMRVVLFQHTPAVTKMSIGEDYTVRALANAGNSRYAGLEIEVSKIGIIILHVYVCFSLDIGISFKIHEFPI